MSSKSSPSFEPLVLASIATVAQHDFRLVVRVHGPATSDEDFTPPLRALVVRTLAEAAGPTDHEGDL